MREGSWRLTDGVHYTKRASARRGRAPTTTRRACAQLRDTMDFRAVTTTSSTENERDLPAACGVARRRRGVAARAVASDGRRSPATVGDGGRACVHPREVDERTTSGRRADDERTTSRRRADARLSRAAR
jgi:hypothetical protein